MHIDIQMNGASQGMMPWNTAADSIKNILKFYAVIFLKTIKSIHAYIGV
jgi:hypothetical protein